MLKRTLTALLLIPPVVYLIDWSPEWLFMLALVAAVVLALREYFELCGRMGFRVFSWIGYVAGAALCLAQVLPGQFAVTPLLVTLVLAISISALWKSEGFKDFLLSTSLTFFGIIYIGLTLSCLVPIRFLVDSFGNVWFAGGGTEWAVRKAGSPAILLLFVVIWAGDICAFLVGRPLGRTPFFARISPRKTWEGAVAGLAGSVLAAWTFAHWFWNSLGLVACLFIAGWVAVAGQAGDLVESAIKRGANQKDSGTILPGHGGFLDRIDSLLFGAPALLLALVLRGWLR